MFKRILTSQDKKNLDRNDRREQWDGSASYAKFWRTRNLNFREALEGTKENSTWGNLVNSKNLGTLGDRIREGTWDIIEDIFKQVGIDLPESKKPRSSLPPIENGPKTPRPANQKKKKKKKDPNGPRGERPDEDERPEKGGGRKQPKPRTFPSLADPPPKRRQREDWNSSVGYFVNISQVSYYEKEPTTHPTPFFDIDFSDTPDGFLSLGENQEWVSPWFSGEVIRGLNVDVIGNTEINYLDNPDFEA